MSATEFLNKLPQAFNAEAAAGADCTILFRTSQPVCATIKDGNCSMSDGDKPDASVTLIMEDDDMVRLLKGELNGMEAFMTGKLQVEGDLGLAQQLAVFFDQDKLATL